jgi:hypothetical protein
MMTYLSRSSPLSVENAGVPSLDAELLEEGVLGLVDQKV